MRTVIDRSITALRTWRDAAVNILVILAPRGNHGRGEGARAFAASPGRGAMEDVEPASTRQWRNRHAESPMSASDEYMMQNDFYFRKRREPA